MNNSLNDTLYDVGEEIFESLAFVLLDFEEEQPPEPEDEAKTAASIAFDGPFEGTLVLGLSTALLPEICANMLGLELGEAKADELKHDAFKELLNVVCGNLLPKIAGEDAVFTVQAADLIADGIVPTTVDEQAPLATACLHLEGGWADLSLFAPQCVAADAASPD